MAEEDGLMQPQPTTEEALPETAAAAEEEEDEATVARKQRLAAKRAQQAAELHAALDAADAAAALTDTPVAPVDSGSSEAADDILADGDSEDDLNGPVLPPKPATDALAAELPSMSSPFDAVYPRTVGAEHWTSITPDSHCWLCELEPAADPAGPTAPVLTRVYINVECKLADGTVCLDYSFEELDFTLGQATVPKGLEMAVCQMRAQQRALVRCGPSYGFSATRRPKHVPADACLFFVVRVLRWEKEKNLHQMDWADKLEYCAKRREWGRELFAAGKLETAVRQYDKALTVLDSVRNHEVDAATVAEKHDLMTTFLVNQAQCHMRSKEFALVLAVTSKALVLNPKHGKALFRRAEAHKAREEWADALSNYDKLLATYEPSLNATDEEKAAFAAKKQADAAVLSAVQSAIATVKRRQSAQSTAQRKRMDGFMTKAASSPSDGASSGLGLYDDMPMRAVTTEDSEADAFAQHEGFANQAQQAYFAVKGSFQALFDIVRSWCGRRPTSSKKEQ